MIRAMVAAGTAVALMGNHELNVLLFHTPGANKEGVPSDYMRAHTSKNVEQHEDFLQQYEGRKAEKQEVHRPHRIREHHRTAVDAPWAAVEESREGDVGQGEYGSSVDLRGTFSGDSALYSRT